MQRTPEGCPIVTGEPGEHLREAAPTISLGRDSEVAVLALEQNVPGAASWLAQRAPMPDQPWRAAVEGPFANRDDVPTCVVSGRLTRGGKITSEVLLDLAHTPFVRQPSIAALHHSLDAVTGLPPEGVSVSMNCPVRRGSGELRDCRAAGPESGMASIAPGVLAAVNRRLRHLRFDPQAIDPNDPAPLRAVRWAERPTGWDLERACPRAALQKEVQAAVEASCRIQPDLSAVCTDARVTSSDADVKHTRLFERAAYEVLTKFRAKPLLPADVTAAVGARFTGSVTFRIAD